MEQPYIFDGIIYNDYLNNNRPNNIKIYRPRPLSPNNSSEKIICKKIKVIHLPRENNNYIQIFKKIRLS